MRSSRRGWPLVLVRAGAVLGWSGCGGVPLAPEADSGTSGGSSSTSISTPAGSTTSHSTTTAALDDTGTSTGVIFLEQPDFISHIECDLFEQDCAPGRKCTVWAFDGGDEWNATKCVPVVDEPAGTDEPCHMEGSPTSGIDDCDFGALCWNVDTETLEGTCLPFCVGDRSNPHCEDPSRICPISSNGSILLCFSVCDPLLQDCPPGQGCYPAYEWQCAPDASGDAGGYGDPCEFINVCDPGLICLNDESVPPGEACEGWGGCCSEVCDLTDPAGDLQCAGAPGGQTCQAWYGDGDAPPGLENVGACALPA